MSENKNTVDRYMEAFRQSDHAAILACLTDDVEWVMPGVYRHVGKAAFDKEIENDAFTGKPTITVTRMIEEGDIVVAEGSVTAAFRAGGTLEAVFCDVFEMQGGKIRKLISYLMQTSQAG